LVVAFAFFYRFIFDVFVSIYDILVCESTNVSYYFYRMGSGVRKTSLTGGACKKN